MAIKEIPTNFRVYYKTMHDAIRPKYEKAVEDYEKRIVEEKAFHSEIIASADKYKANYNFDFAEYPELINNEYSDGKFYDHAKGLFINKKNQYKATSEAYNLFKFAKLQKELYELKHQIDIWAKMLDLKLNDYKKVLYNFYTEVHKQLIVNGYGYVFEQPIGWICINRCKTVNGKRRRLDFKATKANKEKLLAEGKRLWNKEEAAYAASIGREYDGVDYRVYLDEEYCYEIPLINCKIDGRNKYRFETVQTHRAELGKTNQDLIKECNGDLNKLCELEVHLRRKLALCLEADNILYLNFIRNEGQQSVKTPKANRKS